MVIMVSLMMAPVMIFWCFQIVLINCSNDKHRRCNTPTIGKMTETTPFFTSPQFAIIPPGFISATKSNINLLEKQFNKLTTSTKVTSSHGQPNVAPLLAILAFHREYKFYNRERMLLVENDILDWVRGAWLDPNVLV